VNGIRDTGGEIVKDKLKNLKESKQRAKMRLKNLGVSQEEIDQFFESLNNKDQKKKFAKMWFKKKAKLIPDLRRLGQKGFLNLIFS